MKKYKWELIIFTLSLLLTFIARDYEVSRRLSMGLEPSWGGEFLIIPFVAIVYLSLKSDWSVE